MRYNQVSLDAWCEKTFGLSDDEQQKQPSVGRWKLWTSGSQWGDPPRLFAEIRRPKTSTELHEAIVHEAMSAGVRRGRVKALQRGAKNPISTCTWNFEDEDIEDGDDEMEAASGPGNATVGQSLRHNERMFRMYTQIQTDTFRYLGTEIGNLRSENSKLRNENLEVFDIVQKLKDRGHEREQDAKTQELTRETKAMRDVSLSKALDAAVGVVQAKILGVKPTPEEQQSLLARTLADLGESLTPDQIESLVASRILRPEQQVALLELLSGAEPENAEPEDVEPEDAEAEDAEPPKLSLGEAQAVDPKVLKELRASLPEDRYNEAIELLQESQRLLQNPLEMLMRPINDES